MKTLSDKNRFLFLLLFVAILFRIGIFFWALSDDTFGILRFDELYYHDLAFQWANGDFSAPEGAFIMSPLWTALLGLVYATVGLNSLVAAISWYCFNNIYFFNCATNHADKMGFLNRTFIHFYWSSSSMKPFSRRIRSLQQDLSLPLGAF